MQADNLAEVECPDPGRDVPFQGHNGKADIGPEGAGGTTI